MTNITIDELNLAEVIQNIAFEELNKAQYKLLHAKGKKDIDEIGKDFDLKKKEFYDAHEALEKLAKKRKKNK